MVEIEEIERLIALMKASGVMELSVERGDFKVFLRRKPDEIEEIAGEEYPDQEQPSQPATEPPENSKTKTFSTPVISPLVGIFHNGGISDRRSLLKEGDRVKEGQVIAAIEAMKVPNELRSPVNGVVGRILVKDGTGVEYGQTLLLIEPEEAMVGG